MPTPSGKVAKAGALTETSSKATKYALGAAVAFAVYLQLEKTPAVGLSEAPAAQSTTFVNTMIEIGRDYFRLKIFHDRLQLLRQLIYQDLGVVVL